MANHGSSSNKTLTSPKYSPIILASTTPISGEKKTNFALKLDFPINDTKICSFLELLWTEAGPGESTDNWIPCKEP